MTALSELLPAGGAGKVMDFVASGTLPNGKAVVLKGDGTVEVIVQTTATQSVGTTTQFHSTSVNYNGAAFDINSGKVVIAYRNNSNSNGTAIVGTVSGTSISFGTAVVFSSSAGSYISVAADPVNGKVVIAYQGSGGHGKSRVGTVSGTSISFGTEVAFRGAASVLDIAIVYEKSSGKFVIAYRDNPNSLQGTAIVGTISGTSISFGTSVVFETGDTYWIVMASSDDYKVVIAYSDNNNTNNGTAIVGTVSGTSISFGTAAVFNTGSIISFVGIGYDTNNDKFVITFRDSNNGNYATAIVATLSGTSISFGTSVVFWSGNSTQMAVVYDPVAEKIVIFYDDNTGDSAFIVGTVSGTSISFATAVLFDSSVGKFFAPTYDSLNRKTVVAVKAGVNENGYATVIELASVTSNLTSTNFVGITTEAISNTATGSITLQGGVSTNQSSLTSGSTYYVQADGTVSTVSTAPAVNIGKALNATTLKLKGLSV
tara:strand:+ start:568 stop:2025 length:1458 start_codon:yes stop_codon:yes gene_type:complete